MKKLTSIFMAFLMVFSSVYAVAGFDDIDSATYAWAGEAIERLTDSKVINGYEDGTFRPENNVTRAEFAKMVSVAFDLATKDGTYNDIENHWAKDYILSVYGAMYTDGADFKPDEYATRADIAYCASAVVGFEASKDEALQKYSDSKEILPAMKDKVSASVENGIIIGYEDSTLRPNNPVTRAEAAVIICRALDKKDIEDPKPELPPVTDNEKEEDSSVTLPDIEADNTQTAKDSIANLYPGKDIILVVSVNRTVDDETDEDAYKINYMIAGDDTEYSSVVPYDTAVTGVKNSIENLASGDVMIMNTAFLGHIGNLHVFASFSGGNFSYDHTITGYGKGDYVLAGGKIKNVQRAGKNILVTLEAGGLENEVYLPAGAETMEYSSWKKENRWAWGDFGNVDPEAETEYAFIRYTNGVATEIIVSDFER